MSKKLRKAVFAVVYCFFGGKLKYLILRRKLHWKGWEFPKGGVEAGEKMIGAVKREIKEETSLKPAKINKFRISGKYFYNRFARKGRPGFFGQTYTLFSVEVKMGKVTCDKKEHSGYKWLNFNEARKKLKWKNQRKCLEIVNRKILKRIKN